MQILDGPMPLMGVKLAIHSAALTERMSDDRPRTVMRSDDWWSEDLVVALVPQLAAQVWRSLRPLCLLHEPRGEEEGQGGRERRERGRLPEGRSIVLLRLGSWVGRPFDRATTCSSSPRC